MKVIDEHKKWQQLCKSWRREGRTIGFVPTMGALHQGHEALVQAARQNCDVVVASIFVNPLQFAAHEDGDRYPRFLPQDIALLQKHDVAALYAPSPDDVYPDDFVTSVRVAGLTEVLCGVHRPTHFDGVTTVVAKLLMMTQPHEAFFGEKDYQQYVVIRQMVRDLAMDVHIRAVPTVREKDGLACSSRNLYLNESSRAIAPRLYGVLTEGLAAWKDGGQRREIEKECVSQLLRAGFTSVDYVSLVDDMRLQPAQEAQRRSHCRLCAAAFLGNVRLIDNVGI